MMACGYAAAFGAIQQMPRIVPGPAGGARAAAPAQSNRPSAPCSRSRNSAASPAGPAGLPRGAHRRAGASCCACSRCPGLILLPLVFARRGDEQPHVLQWGIFFFGLTTIAQFSFWGNYLPRVYPDASARHRRKLRGERRRPHDRHVGRAGDDAAGERDAGRLRADQARVRVGARRDARLRLGLLASFWLPEPKKEELPDCRASATKAAKIALGRETSRCDRARS